MKLQISPVECRFAEKSKTLPAPGSEPSGVSQDVGVQGQKFLGELVAG